MTDTGGHAGETKPLDIARRCLAFVAASFAMLVRPARYRGGDAWRFDPQQLAVRAGIAVVIFVLCMIFIDAAAINATHGAPKLVKWFFAEITDFGKSGWFLWPLGIVFLLIAAVTSMLERPAQAVLAAIAVRVGFLFAAIAVPGIFVNIVKHIFGRARPMVTGIADPFVFRPFTWPAAYASLPSGHAATAFSVLVAFGALWPRARTALWIYALLILASRVFVNAHYPSDVFAGALVGGIGALLVMRWFALLGLGFSIAPDGVPRAWPGPSLARIKAVARALLA